VAELTEEVEREEEDCPQVDRGQFATMPMVILCISGVLPWSSRTSRVWKKPSAWYQVGIIALAILSLCSIVHHSVTVIGGHDIRTDGRRIPRLLETTFRPALLSDIPLALGSILGLLFLGVLRENQPLLNCIALLTSHLNNKSVLLSQDWARLVRRKMLVTLMIWAIVVGERWRGSGGMHHAWRGTLMLWDAIPLLAFTLISTIIVGLASCVICISYALCTMIDTFCCGVLSQSATEATEDWNLLQAVLRRASSTLECSFFCIIASCFGALLISVVDVGNGRNSNGIERLLPCLPGGLLIACVAHAFLHAAAVTDRCTRVPPLVNSFSVLPEERQRIVEYVVNSGAGFHMFDCRLSMALALKCAHFMGVVAFGLTTQTAW